MRNKYKKTLKRREIIIIAEIEKEEMKKRGGEREREREKERERERAHVAEWLERALVVREV